LIAAQLAGELVGVAAASQVFNVEQRVAAGARLGQCVGRQLLARGEEWEVLGLLLVVAEPLRNAGKYTMADVLAYRLKPRPVRAMASLSTLTVNSVALVNRS